MVTSVMVIGMHRIPTGSPGIDRSYDVYVVFLDGRVDYDTAIQIMIPAGIYFLHQENFNVRSPNVYYYTTEEYHGDAISAYFIFSDGSPRRVNLNITNSYGQNSPNLNNGPLISCIVYKNGIIDSDSWHVYDSYGKFQSKLITVREFIIPSILEALNYDFYVGHVYGFS